jgi:hypothetical protein
LTGVGAAGLALEAIVLLLAAPAVATLRRGHVPVAGIGYLLAVALLLVLAAASLRRRHGLLVATAAQLAVVAAGTVTWPMYLLGAAFTALWVYYLRLWRLPG